VITATGIYQLYYPPETTTILAELHPNLWWGLVMVVVGSAFYLGGNKHSA